MSSALSDIRYLILVLLLSCLPLVFYPPISSPEATPKLLCALILCSAGAFVSGITGFALRDSNGTVHSSRLLDTALLFLAAAAVMPLYLYPGQALVSLLGRDDMRISVLWILIALTSAYFASRLNLNQIERKNLLWFFMWSVALADISLAINAIDLPLTRNIAEILTSVGITFNLNGSFGSSPFALGANAAALASGLVLFKVEYKRSLILFAFLLTLIFAAAIIAQAGATRAVFVLLPVALLALLVLPKNRVRALDSSEATVPASTRAASILRTSLVTIFIGIIAVGGIYVGHVKQDESVQKTLNYAEHQTTSGGPSEIFMVASRMDNAPVGAGNYARVLWFEDKLVREPLNGQFPLYAGNSWLELFACLGPWFVITIFCILGGLVFRALRSSKRDMLTPQIYVLPAFALFLTASVSHPDPMNLLLLFTFFGLAASSFRQDIDSALPSGMVSDVDMRRAKTEMVHHPLQILITAIFATALVVSLIFAYQTLAIKAKLVKSQKTINLTGLAEVAASNLPLHPDKITAARILIFEGFSTKNESIADAGFSSLSNLIDLDPTNIWLREELVDNYILNNDFSGALSELVFISKYVYQDVQTQNGIGFMYFKSGEYEKAVAAYEDSLQIDPNKGITHSLLSQAYLKMGSVDASKSYDLKAQEVDK